MFLCLGCRGRRNVGQHCAVPSNEKNLKHVKSSVSLAAKVACSPHNI